MIVNNVLTLRTESKVTQCQLAEAVGVTRQTIIAIEKGNYTPSVELAIKIARYFKVKTDSVFTIID